jgi:hypothetical protein
MGPVSELFDSRVHHLRVDANVEFPPSSECARIASKFTVRLDKSPSGLTSITAGVVPVPADTERKQKVAMVTGGADGVRRAHRLRLAKLGADGAIIDIDRGVAVAMAKC